MSEFEAMERCLTALDSLTPCERERVLHWLNDRVWSDIEKGRYAARVVGTFLAVMRPRRARGKATAAGKATATVAKRKELSG